MKRDISSRNENSDLILFQETQHNQREHSPHDGASDRTRASRAAGPCRHSSLEEFNQPRNAHRLPTLLRQYGRDVAKQQR